MATASYGWFEYNSSPTAQGYCSATITRSGTTVTVSWSAQISFKYSTGNVGTGYYGSIIVSCNNHSQTLEWKNTKTAWSYSTNPHTVNGSFSWTDTDTSTTSRTVTFTPTNSNSQVISNWGPQTLTVGMDAYVYPTYWVTVRRGTGISDITSPAWAWDSTGSYKSNQVTQGTTLNFNVAISTGYHWGSWSGTFSTTTQSYNYTINGAVDVTATAVANSYTIKYNANGGSGSMSDTGATYNSAVTLRTNTFTRSHYTFKNWNTKADGSGTSYSNGASVSNLTSTNGGTVTLYAQWTGVTYTVSYNANGGTSTPSSQSAVYPNTVTLRSAISKSSTTTTGYTVTYNANGGSGAPSGQTSGVRTVTWSFSKWAAGSTSGSQYSAGASYQPSGNVTMYAIWTSSTSANSSWTCSSSVPTRTGYTFLGWSTSSTATGATYKAGTTYTITGALTLYAVWKATVPYSLSMSRTSSSTSGITLSLLATSQITISSYKVYYKKTTESAYATVTWSSSSGTLNGLSMDTNYHIYFTATNSTGTSSNSTIYTFSTLLSTPSITGYSFIEVTPFTATSTITTDLDATHQMYYMHKARHTTVEGEEYTTGYKHNNFNMFPLSRWASYGFDVFMEGYGSTTTTGISVYSVNGDGYTQTMHWTTANATEANKQVVIKYGCPARAGVTYALAYTPSNSSRETQCWLHFYDENYNVLSLPGIGSATSSTRRVLTATAPEGTCFMSARFDNDDSNTTVEFQDIYLGVDLTGTYTDNYVDSNVYYWTDLPEETNITMTTVACAWPTGVNALATENAVNTSITTPADQAKIRRKVDGQWVKGKAYFKEDGAWVKAKKIYKKIDGVWYINTNYDS